MRVLDSIRELDLRHGLLHPYGKQAKIQKHFKPDLDMYREFCIQRIAKGSTKRSTTDITTESTKGIITTDSYH
jgi:hypothetical protein